LADTEAPLEAEVETNRFPEFDFSAALMADADSIDLAEITFDDS
jgi:hypothetical protein